MPTFTERDFTLLTWAMIAFPYLPIKKRMIILIIWQLPTKHSKVEDNHCIAAIFVPYRPLYYIKHYQVNNGLERNLAKALMLTNDDPIQ